MTESTPAHTYYQACVGTWRAPLDVVVTSPVELRRALGTVNAAAFRMLAGWPELLGPTEIRTSVKMLSEDEVEHTTKLMIKELEAVSTTETIRLLADGRAFVIIGVARTFLDPSGTAISGKGAVAEDAASASYTIDFMGSRLDQKTTREGDRVTLYWEGAGYTGVQRLARQTS
jgi:hypothetical protein